jgi:GNAT superfamily N-acetyltransferase
MGDLIGTEAHARLSAIFGNVGPRADALAPPEHWYLMLLGVDPARQGQGLGAEVMAPVLARADADRLPCWLETFDSRNVSFYLRHGFAVVEEGVEPTSGLRYRLMLRDPR